MSNHSNDYCVPLVVVIIVVVIFVVVVAVAAVVIVIVIIVVIIVVVFCSTCCFVFLASSMPEGLPENRFQRKPYRGFSVWTWHGWTACCFGSFLSRLKVNGASYMNGVVIVV